MTKTTALTVVLLATVAGCSASADETVHLFNGRDLSGWQHVGEGGFSIEDGMLRTEGGMGLLWYSERMLEDETLRVVYRTVDTANAGIFIRIPEAPTEPWMPVDRGYEVQIEDRGDDYHVSGTLYSLTRAKARPFETDEWNTMDIMLEGDRTAVEINGVLVTDYTEGDPVPEKKADWEPERGLRPRAGYIGLQNHGEGETVYFREVSIHPLKP